MHPQPPRRTTHAYGTPKNLLVHDRWGRFGRPVVLLHGLNYDRTMWWPVAAELVSTCSAVAVDLPGHGQSAPRDPDGFGRLVHDLAMLVHGLNLQRAPILVGHAESGRIAEAFAERYATHALITVDDEPDRQPDLDEVPEMYRQFAVPQPDLGEHQAYRNWLATASGQRRAQTTAPARVRVGAASCADFAGQSFPHLRDPARFASLLLTLH